MSNVEKSMRCVESPDSASEPLTVDWPDATTVPAAFRSVHATGEVDVLTSVATLATPGT